MGKPKGKQIRSALLRALIAGAETSAAVKIPAAFISELAKLSEDKQNQVARIPKEQFIELLTQSELATIHSATSAVEAKQIKALVKELIAKIDTIAAELHKGDGGKVVKKAGGPGIFISKLPVTLGDLFGRDGELDMLDEIWEKGESNIVSFVAWGGVGKTALVNKWLNYRMGLDNYRGAESVFGWSFYSQGARADRQASGDEFIDKALRFFGDPDPEKGSAWDKGVRLAELVGVQKGLLVLDGLEPLQNPPGTGNIEGQVRDTAVGALLRGLAAQNAGLCVVSTRIAIDDLKGFAEPAVRQIDLEDLSAEAGAELLKKERVVGPDNELEEAAKEYGGHALALTLLGSYLATVHNGDIRKRDDVPGLTEDEEQGGHARRVMKSYEIWLKDSAELDILYVMGLFDRPAEEVAIDALRKKPVIGGLTDRLMGFSEPKWRFAVKRLRDVRLVGAEDSGGSGVLDCHPLVREYFGAELRSQNEAAWREGHNRLYEYYKSVPAKEQPDTVEEMGPLYRAVAHGCCAGRYEEALSEVYWGRIQRRDEYYNIKKLGAIGSDLACLAGFFAEVWERPVDELTESARALVLNQAGCDLRALGRLGEAAGPMKAGLDMYVEQKNWANTARVAGNISELELVLGEMEEAVGYGKRSVEFADKGGYKFFQVIMRTVLADALHQSGRVGEAEELFKEAENMQKEYEPEFPLLYSVQGFQYCDLLLGQGKYKEVLERASQTLEWAKQAGASLLTIALDELSLGKAYLSGGQKEWSRAGELDAHFHGDRAEEHLTAAVDGLRKAEQIQFLPLCLLARAELRRVTGDFAAAQRDLDEAFGMAGRCGMRLYEVDCYIGYARLYTDMKKKQKAKENLDKAKELIGQTGYRRREEEVEGLPGV